MSTKLTHTTRASTCRIQELPNEILLRVSVFLDDADVLKWRFTCKRLQKFYEENWNLLHKTWVLFWDESWESNGVKENFKQLPPWAFSIVLKKAYLVRHPPQRAFIREFMAEVHQREISACLESLKDINWKEDETLEACKKFTGRVRSFLEQEFPDNFVKRECLKECIVNKTFKKAPNEIFEKTPWNELLKVELAIVMKVQQQKLDRHATAKMQHYKARLANGIPYIRFLIDEGAEECILRREVIKYQAKRNHVDRSLKR
jgi:hypothetical protein